MHKPNDLSDRLAIMNSHAAGLLPAPQITSHTQPNSF